MYNGNTDGNLEALRQYEQHIEKEEIAYEELLEALRNVDPEDYESIAEEYGWGDVDLITIIEDI